MLTGNKALTGYAIEHVRIYYHKNFIDCEKKSYEKKSHSKSQFWFGDVGRKRLLLKLLKMM